MSDKFYKIAVRILIVTISLSSLAVLIGISALIKSEFRETSRQALPFPEEVEEKSLSTALETVNTTLDVPLSTITEYAVPGEYSSVGAVPTFVQYDTAQKKLIIHPTSRANVGEYEIELIPADPEITPTSVLNINVQLKSIDLASMEAEIMQIIGTGNANIGIYVEDYLRGKVYTYNASHQYKPGSISKLPVSFITLLDLQSGKLSLNSTFPVYNQYKHSTYDNIGKLAAGTPVTIDTYLTELYRLSNNTAQYHLRELIGNPTQSPGIWSSGVLNQRVKNELGVAQWGEDPHIVTGLDVGKVFGDIYRDKLFNFQWKHYFLDKLGSAASSLREGIPAGVPASVRVVNKVGFLYGGSDNVYSDVGIVFGKNTDYMIAVLNNAAPPYPQGKNIIKAISQVVYSHLDI